MTAYLYEFSIGYPGATTYFRYTGFQRDLTYNGFTWTAAPIEHGDILETDRLERQEPRKFHLGALVDR